MMMGNREKTNGVLVDAKPHLEFCKIERKIMTVVVDISFNLVIIFTSSSAPNPTIFFSKQALQTTNLNSTNLNSLRTFHLFTKVCSSLKETVFCKGRTYNAGHSAREKNISTFFLKSGSRGNQKKTNQTMQT
jgi:hypothetical protein